MVAATSGGQSSGGVGSLTIGTGGSFSVLGDAFIGGTPTSAGGHATVAINNGGVLSANGALKIWNSGGGGVQVNPGASVSVGALDTSGFPGYFHWTGGTLSVTGAGGLTIGGSGPLGSNVTIGPFQSLNVAQTLTLANFTTLTTNIGPVTLG